MARIRTIKPEFWTSEQVIECCPLTRLLFIGMWNFADDHGRMSASAKTMKAQIFPADDLSVENILGMISELSERGLVTLYSVDGKEYLQIKGWHHQRIDKPQAAKHPAPISGHSENVRGTFDVGEERKGKETEDDEEARASRSLISQAAYEISDTVASDAGFPTPDACPPGWCGFPMRVQSFLDSGYSAEIILLGCREALRRKRDGPPQSFAYFDKPIAEARARAEKPLPVVKIVEPETVHVRSQADSSVVAGAHRILAKMREFDRSGGGGEPGGNDVRLLPQGGRG